MVFALRSKELDMKSTNETMSRNRDAMSIWDRTKNKEFKGGRFNSRSKSRSNKPLRCFIYHKERNFEWDYYERKKRYKDKDRKIRGAKASVAHDANESVDTLMKALPQKNGY